MNSLTQIKKVLILPLLIALALIALALPKVTHADAVTDWNQIASTAIVTTAGQPPPVSALTLRWCRARFMTQSTRSTVAISRISCSLNQIRPTRRKRQRDGGVSRARGFRSARLVPGQLSTLQPQYDAYIAGLPDDPPGHEDAGIAIGEATARAMLIARMNDGRFGPPPDLYPPAPGIWRPTPPNFANDPAPWVGNVRPFLVPSAEMLRTDGPNALTSAAYTEDFNEVKELGSLTARLEHRTKPMPRFSGRITQLRSGTGSFARWPPVRSWTSSRAPDSSRWRTSLRLTPRLAAGTTSTTGSSGGLLLRFARPTPTATPHTEPDPTWLPLFDPATPVCNPPPLVTPPFPEHPSGHACATSAFVHTLQNFFGTDKIAFGAFSNKSCTTRSFDRFSDALKEVIDARVWAGIHFRTADVQGAVLGKKVAQYLKKHYFQPVRCHQ